MDREEGKSSKVERPLRISTGVVEQEITRLQQRRARRGRLMLVAMAILTVAIICLVIAMYIWPGQVQAGAGLQWPSGKIVEVGCEGNG